MDSSDTVGADVEVISAKKLKLYRIWIDISLVSLSHYGSMKLVGLHTNLPQISAFHVGKYTMHGS